MEAIPTTPLAFATFAALSLLAVLWGMVRAQNKEQGEAIKTLQVQNIEQQKELTRLTTQMRAREDAHEQHREHTNATLANFRTDLRDINSKLDRLLGVGGKRSDSPTPGRYGG